VVDEFCSSPDPSPNKSKNSFATTAILEKVPPKLQTKTTEMGNSPARKKAVGGKSSAQNTPDGKRKQRDIRSFFTPPASDSSSGQTTKNNTDGNGLVNIEMERKKTPVKLRFEGGEISRIISTDEVLKKDLALIKVVSSDIAPPPSIKDEFDKSIEIKTESFTKIDDKQLKNAQLNEKYAKMLGTSIAAMKEKKLAQEALLNKKGTPDSNADKKRRGKRSDEFNGQESKKAKMDEDVKPVIKPKQGRKIKLELTEAVLKSGRPKRVIESPGSQLEAAKRKNAGVEAVVQPKARKVVKVTSRPTSPEMIELPKVSRVRNVSQPQKTPSPSEKKSGAAKTCTPSPEKRPGAVNIPEKKSGTDKNVATPVQEKTGRTPRSPRSEKSVPKKDESSYQKEFLKSITVKTEPASPSKMVNGVNKSPPPKTATARTGPNTLKIVQAMALLSPSKQIDGHKALNGHTEIPTELTNGHSPAPRRSPNARTPRKIKKEEFVLFPTGFKVKEEPRDDKTSPSKLPPYNVMIKHALTELNSVGGEGCTKLELLLFILRTYQPKDDIANVTNKLIQMLEVGIKKGMLLSSASCTPRKRLVDPNQHKPNHPPQKQNPTKHNQPTKVASAEEAKKEGGKEVRKEGDKEATKVVKKDGGEKEKSKTIVQAGKKTLPSRKGMKIGITPKRLKEPLASICKSKKMSRVDALRKTWVYIHQKKLLDPSDKTRIICDEKLKKLTKSKAIGSKALLGFVRDCMEPL